MKSLVIALGLLVTANAFAGPAENIINERKLTCATETGVVLASVQNLMIGEGIGNAYYQDRIIENSTGEQRTHIVEQGGSCMALSCPASYSGATASVTIYGDGYTGKLGKQAELAIDGKTISCDVQADPNEIKNGQAYSF